MFNPQEWIQKSWNNEGTKLIKVAGNTAICMGTVALPSKTYRPIRALDESGQPLTNIDEEGNSIPVYQKRRVPHTGSGRFVLRENGKASEGIEWIYCDGAEYDGEGTTLDIEEAQYDYDNAICYNLDWSELLIEGDTCPITFFKWCSKQFVCRMLLCLLDSCS
jgi:hypothetical protein